MPVDMTPEEKAAAEKQAAEKAKQEADAKAKAEADAKAKAEAEAKIKAELEAKAKAEAEAKELADLRAWKAESDRAKLTAAERAEADRQAQARAEADRAAKAAEDQRKRDEEMTRLAGESAKREQEAASLRAALAESKVHDKLRELGVPHKNTRLLGAYLIKDGPPVLTQTGELDDATIKRVEAIIGEYPEMARRGNGIGADGGRRSDGGKTQQKNWYTQAFDTRVTKTGGGQ